MSQVTELMKGFALKFSDQTAAEMVTALSRAGFVIVPREPTKNMIKAGSVVTDPEAIYRNMLSEALSE